MPGIGLVTDGASDLGAALLGSLPVAVVPLDVRLGALGPEQTRALSAEAFWRECASTSALPETSAPSPGEFQQAFLRAAEQGCDGVVCVTLSSELSATHQAALAAAAEVSDRVPVEVIDSRTVTLAEGLIVLEGAERAAAGQPLDQVVAGVREAIGKVVAFGALATLDNLRRGGRIGAAQAFFGSLLSVKPVVEVRDGVVQGESRQRTRARSLQYLADKARALGPLRRLAVAHAAAPDLDQLLDLLADVYPREQILVAHIGPVVGAHTGPGTVAVCAQRA